MECDVTTKTAYLKPLRINEGQFSNEKAIVLKDWQETQTSGFIENKYIKNGKLEVEIIVECNELVLIRLPCRMLEPPGDKGYLSVKKDWLEYAI